MNGGGLNYKIFYPINKLSLEAFILAAPTLLFYPINIWLVLVSYMILFLSIRLGHGQYMDLGDWRGRVEPEKIDFLIEPLFDTDPNVLEDDAQGSYWRDLFGLTLTGTIGIIPICTLLAWNGAMYSCIAIAIGGTLKGIGYAIGKLITKEYTVVGEWLRGMFLWSSFAIGYILWQTM